MTKDKYFWSIIGVSFLYGTFCYFHPNTWLIQSMYYGVFSLMLTVIYIKEK